MNEHTVCQSFGSPSTPDSTKTGGCLVRIYPAAGPVGLWDLEHDEVHLGRSPECLIVLDDDSVSRRHAAIQNTARGHLLIDLNSTNGTYVNHDRIDEYVLVAGDQIHIGTQIFKYLSSDNIERQYYETVYTMTTKDALTNAFNKQYLLEALGRELCRHRRYQRPLAVAMIDIDFFKLINDTHGHLAGDEVLQELSRRVQKIIEDDDLFARFGGEEFAIIFSESSQEEAAEICEEIRDVIWSAPFSTSAGPISVSISLGIAAIDLGQSVTVDEVLAVADRQLYRSKQNGRNQTSAANLDDTLPTG